MLNEQVVSTREYKCGECGWIHDNLIYNIVQDDSVIDSYVLCVDCDTDRDQLNYLINPPGIV